MKKIFCFPKATLVSIVILGLLILFFIYFFSNVSEKDRKDYTAIMEQTDATKNLEPYIARQHHDHVCKEMWYFNKGQRLQMRLKSKNATLVLNRNLEKTEIIEKMDDLTCIMQTELFYRLKDGTEIIRHPDGKYFLKNNQLTEVDIKGRQAKPMQHVRFFTASRASYYYSDDRLIADKVNISQYELPGHSLAEFFEKKNPLMSGVADMIEFRLIEHNLNFKAHHFKATVFAGDIIK